MTSHREGRRFSCCWTGSPCSWSAAVITGHCKCVPHRAEIFEVRDSPAKCPTRRTWDLACKRLLGLQDMCSHLPVAAPPIETGTNQFHLPQRLQETAGLGLSTAQSSLLGVHKLSSESTPVMKKMIIPAFTPVTWLNVHHKRGFPCKPGTVSVQAAIGCVFRRPRPAAASKG